MLAGVAGTPRERSAKAGPYAGDQLASSFIAVLQRGDPEPQAPFAIVGPGANGLALFLHGPVQAWDSGRWLAPQPVPGWMATSIGRPWPLIILPYGAAPPPQSQQGNPFDLVSGAVPGSGFVLLRPPTGPGQASGAAAGHRFVAYSSRGRRSQDREREGRCPSADSLAMAPSLVELAPGRAAAALGQVVPGRCRVALGQANRAWQRRRLRYAGAVGAAAGNAGPFGHGGHLRAEQAARSTCAVSSPRCSRRSRSHRARRPRSRPERPEVQGVRCELGHFNHPRVTNCMRCGRPVPPGSPQVSGPRPAAGVLLADDGSIWALGRPCIIGAEPTSAAEVQAGAAQAIAMRAAQDHPMAPVHAEVQAKGWSAYLVDRGADGGTFFQGPGRRDGPSWAATSNGN